MNEADSSPDTYEGHVLDAGCQCGPEVVAVEPREPVTHQLEAVLVAESTMEVTRGEG